MKLLLAGFLLLARPAFSAVGLVNHQGARVALENITVTDDDGRRAPLASFFHPGRPVLLTPVFYGCRGVCTVTLANLVSALKLVNPSPGRGYELLAVSIAPGETAGQARAFKQTYFDSYARPETAPGWHFLTASADDVATLTGALGFQFERSPDGMISHPSALYVLSPDGVITATLPGTAFSPKEIRAALFEAREGRVEIFKQRLSALCYAYMPHAGFLNSPRRWMLALVSFFGLVAMGAALLVRRPRRELRLS